MSLKSQVNSRFATRPIRARRLAGLVLAAMTLSACSTTYDVVPVASIGPRPEQPAGLMSAAEKDETIAELKAEAARNNALGF